MPGGQIQSISCFCTAFEFRNNFTFLNGWKKLKKNNTLWDVQIVWNVNISVYKKASWAHSHTHFFVAAFVSQCQSWVGAARLTARLAKLHIFIFWSFREEVCQCLHCVKTDTQQFWSLLLSTLASFALFLVTLWTCSYGTSHHLESLHLCLVEIGPTSFLWGSSLGNRFSAPGSLCFGLCYQKHWFAWPQKSTLLICKTVLCFDFEGVIFTWRVPKIQP